MKKWETGELKSEDVNEGIKNIKLHIDLGGASFLKRYDWSSRALISDTKWTHRFSRIRASIQTAIQTHRVIVDLLKEGTFRTLTVSQRFRALGNLSHRRGCHYLGSVSLNYCLPVFVPFKLKLSQRHAQSAKFPVFCPPELLHSNAKRTYV